MKCPKCQTDNPETQKFCGECGTNFTHPDDAQPSFTKTLETPVEALTRGILFADRYEIIEELGKGGMGAVYRVEDTKTKEEIALKLIKPEISSDRKTIERFRNELTTARKIRHKNICGMYDLNEEKGTQYITMEYVSGEDLKSFLKRSGHLTLPKTMSLSKQICEGLSEAHGLGIVHRDLKPSNIMIDKNGNARIMDFGIARSFKAKGVTGAGVMIGTPEYMSPEQVDGKDVDQRSDIYSLGIILYEMLTGRLPFEGETPFSIGVKQKSETPEPPQKFNARIPDDLNRLILKCLEKEKENRPQNTDETCSEISRIEEGSTTTTKPVTDKRTRTSREVTVTFSSRKILIPALVFIAVVVVGIILWRTLRPSDAYIPPEERFSIAVISFENQTGDDTYAHLQKVIPNLLITNLEQSGYFNVTTWERLRDLLKQVDKGEVEFIDSDLGFELCRMEGVEAIVIGSYAKAGDMFATDVKVMEVASKKLLKSTSTRGEGEGSILKTQIDELSEEISTGVGIPESKLAAAPMQIENYTSSSLEAYKYFLEGRDALYNFYFTEALQLLKKAVEIDPNYGTAYYFLAYVNGVLGNIRARDEAIKKGKEAIATGVTELERMWINAFYARYVEKDRDKALRILKEMALKFPKEKRVLHALGLYISDNEPETAVEAYKNALELDPSFAIAVNNLAYTYLDIGNYTEAEKYFKRYVEMVPGEANPYDSLGDLYFNMGRLEEAASRFKQASEIRPEQFTSYDKLGYVVALQQDYPAALEWFQKYTEYVSAPGDKVSGYCWKGFLLVWLGRYKEALVDLQRAEELAGALGDEITTAFINRFRAWIYLDMGELELSRSYNDQWVATYQKNRPHNMPRYECFRLCLHGFIDLEQGLIESAKKRLESIQSLNPEINTPLYWVLQGAVSLVDNSPDLAMTALERISIENLYSDLQYVHSTIVYNLPFFLDGKAQALAKKNELDLALAEYQKLIAFDPSSENRRLIHPKYYYRLARVYEEKGDLTKAREHYQKFLTLWKDADPGLPEVADARERVAGLKE